MSATGDTTGAGRTGSFARLRARLRNRADSEHEMSFNRLFFAILILIYVWAVGPAGTGRILFAVALWAVMAVGIFAHILLRPAVSARRRFVAVVLDLGFLSWYLHIGGEATSAFFPIYLWVILGNGFRFGVPSLRVAMAVGLVAFAAVIVTTPFWRDQIHLSGGLLLGMLLVPAYAGTLIRKLEHARHQAEQANQAKTLFLASVSHELRTPLNAIIGMGALLKDTRLDRTQEEMAQTIDGAAKSLLSLIDGILDYSRIEAGDVRVEEVEFDLLAVLDEVRRMVALQAREKGLRLSFHVTARTPQRLKGDRRHLQEILLNLANNAVKFTEAGSVVIAADAIPVHEPTPEGPVRLRFEVADTGIGIAPDAVDRVFESFTQADSSILNRFGGTGLGLAICRRLVELHGGTIGVESQPGAGSNFWFTVNATLPPPPSGVPAAAPAPSFAGAGAILLTGDPAAAKVIPALLEALKVEATTARSTAQAVALIRERIAEPPERRIVLVDPSGLGADAHAIASTLHGLDPNGTLQLILVADPATPPGLPALELRRDFVAMLTPPFSEAELGGALLLAGAGRGAARPATRGVAAAGGTAEEGGAGSQQAPSRRLHVLVADDNRVNRRVVEKILESAGHGCELVANGEEALDALERTRFDLVLMDLNMPVMDGIEAVKTYRFMEFGARIPVVGLTADATPEARTRCLEAGMDECVIKPVEPSRLLAVVETLAAGDRAEASPPAPVEPEKDDPAVTEIASHPRFRPAGSAAVEEDTLADLQALGGDAFLAGLIDDFLAEAQSLVQELSEAVASGNAAQFRAQSHALGSGALNIGARGIGELCRSGQQMRPADLAARGPAHVQRLTMELDRVRHALLPRRAVAGEAGKPR
jgi:two-component system sensor histidine kinase RpfC